MSSFTTTLLSKTRSQAVVVRELPKINKEDIISELVNLNVKPLSCQKIYLAYVRPILTYGSKLWGGTASSYLKKLQVVQNSYLRLIYKKKEERISIKKLHALAEIPTLKAHITEFTPKYNATNHGFQIKDLQKSINFHTDRKCNLLPC